MQISDYDMANWQNHLQGFIDEIDRCVRNAEWERLAEALDVRQSYLMRLYSFSDAFSEEQNLILKKCLETTLARDEAFVSVIEAQKKLSVTQQTMLERGKKAVSVYNSY